jgi:hypothetical protein
MLVVFTMVFSSSSHVAQLKPLRWDMVDLAKVRSIFPSNRFLDSYHLCRDTFPRYKPMDISVAMHFDRS